jgi:transcriptional antiterminator RfaH
VNWERVNEALRWYVIRTQPRQEIRAENNLRAWRVETFNPRFKERHFNQYTGHPICHIKSLFPQYIFARFEAHCLISKICHTRGVRTVVNFGEGPTAVDDEIIELLKSQRDEEGFIRMGTSLKVGDKVTVEGGPLKGLRGVFEREAKDSERVLILLSCVSYTGRVVVERESVRKSNDGMH